MKLPLRSFENGEEKIWIDREAVWTRGLVLTSVAFEELGPRARDDSCRPRAIPKKMKCISTILKSMST